MIIALVRLDQTVCPVCGAVLRVMVWEQLPLLRHGGYGAALRTTLRYCPVCSFARRPDVGEVNPR